MSPLKIFVKLRTIIELSGSEENQIFQPLNLFRLNRQLEFASFQYNKVTVIQILFYSSTSKQVSKILTLNL
jgi:hypothetical protein